jgi:hypothetical protein
MNSKIKRYGWITDLPDQRDHLYALPPATPSFLASYESFESIAVARTWKAPTPEGRTEKQLGGHALLAVGHGEATQRFIVSNSWGAS